MPEKPAATKRPRDLRQLAQQRPRVGRHVVEPGDAARERGVLQRGDAPRGGGGQRLQALGRRRLRELVGGNAAAAVEAAHERPAARLRPVVHRARRVDAGGADRWQPRRVLQDRHLVEFALDRQRNADASEQRPRPRAGRGDDDGRLDRPPSGSTRRGRGPAADADRRAPPCAGGTTRPSRGRAPGSRRRRPRRRHSRNRAPRPPPDVRRRASTPGRSRAAPPASPPACPRRATAAWPRWLRSRSRSPAGTMRTKPVRRKSPGRPTISGQRSKILEAPCARAAPPARSCSACAPGPTSGRCRRAPARPCRARRSARPPARQVEGDRGAGDAGAEDDDVRGLSAAPGRLRRSRSTCRAALCPGAPVTPPPGMGARAAQVEALDRRAVARPAGHRPHEEELLQGQVAVEDVALGQAEPALEVERRQDLRRLAPRRHVGRVFARSSRSRGRPSSSRHASQVPSPQPVRARTARSRSSRAGPAAPASDPRSRRPRSPPRARRAARRAGRFRSSARRTPATAPA